MVRIARVVLIVGCALGLTGCNETVSGGSAGPVASAPATIRAPAGTGCGAEIDRFRSVVASDHDTGNVEQTVYGQIEAELARASAACAAGKTGEAHAIVAASKARHGYRA